MGDCADVILVFISPIITLFGAFVILYLRDIWLKKRDWQKQIRREIIEKKLTYLYAPLYANLEFGNEFIGKKTLITTKSSQDKGDGKLKELLDETIQRYLFLASPRLKPYLVKVYGANFYHITKADADKLLKYIEEDYEALKKEWESA